MFINLSFLLVQYFRKFHFRSSSWIVFQTLYLVKIIILNFEPIHIIISIIIITKNKLIPSVIRGRKLQIEVLFKTINASRKEGN